MITNMLSVPSKKLTPVQLLDILFKHKYVILAVVVITGLVTVLVSLVNPPEYESNAILMVNVGREYIYRPEYGDPIYGTNRTYRLVEMVNSEIQILSSRDIKEKVINTLGIANIYPELLAQNNPLEMAIQVFEKSLAVKSIVDSSIIHLYFDHQDPVIAAKALNLLIEVFNQKHLQVYENSLLPFLEEQLGTNEEQLKSAEEDLENFKQKNGVYDIDKQTDLLLTQRSDLERTLNDVENEIKETEEKDVALQAQMNRLPQNVPMYTETNSVDINAESKAKLLELQVEEQKLLSKYTENSRLVQNIRNEIRSVKALLASQGGINAGMVRTGKNPVLDALELQSIQSKASLQSLSAKRDVVKQQIENLNAQLKEIDTKQNEIRELERNVSIFTKNHSAYLEKLEEAQSENALDRLKNTSIRVVESAQVPIKPLGLSTKMRLALGLLFGLVAGICLAFVAEFNQRRLSNAYAVEHRLQLPVLTVLPERE